MNTQTALLDTPTEKNQKPFAAWRWKCCKFRLRICRRCKISGGCDAGSGELPMPAENLLFFVASHELVALDGGDHTNRAFFARLGALYTPEASDADRSG